MPTFRCRQNVHQMTMASDTTESDFKFNATFFRRFWTLLTIMFPKFLSMTTLVAFVVLLLGGLDQLLTYQVGILPSEFYDVLGHRDVEGFKLTSLKSLGLILGKATVLSTISFAVGILYIRWRRAVTSAMHALYFRRFTYYDLNHLMSLKDLDNPDQRMTQDVEKTCRIFGDIFSKIIMSPFIVAYYTYKTWQTSGYLGPLSIYSYFVAATLANKLLMSPVVRLVSKQEKSEGDFRYKHAMIRSNSEEIAFLRAGSLEQWFTDFELGRLLATQQLLVNWRFLLNYVTNTVDYFGSLLSYWIVAIPVLVEGKFDDADPVSITSMISRNSFYYMYLINSFSTLINLNAKVTDMAGAAHRVAYLYQVLVDLNSAPKVNLHSTDKTTYEGNFSHRKDDNDDAEKGCLSLLSRSLSDVPFVSLRDVTIRIPGTNITLIKGLNLDVYQGKHLLITGSSGSGKTSLLRVLCNFWEASSGTITWQLPNRLPCILYLPQKPYLPKATLRQQILYPYRIDYCEPDKNNKGLEELLKSLDMNHLTERCGGLDAPVSWDWNHVLTPGESQRLSVLRALYHKPLLVIMDEISSAVGLDYERKIYAMLHQSGATLISVGHRESLQSVHDVRLHIDKDTAGYSLIRLR